MPRRHRPVPSACLSSRRNRPHAPADDRAWAAAAPRHATLCEFLRKQEPRTSRSARRPGLLLSQELALRGEGNGVPLPARWDDGSTLPSSCESRNPDAATAPAGLGSCFSQERTLRRAILRPPPTRHAERVSASIAPTGTVGAGGGMAPRIPSRAAAPRPCRPCSYPAALRRVGGGSSTFLRNEHKSSTGHRQHSGVRALQT